MPAFRGRETCATWWPFVPLVAPLSVIVVSAGRCGYRCRCREDKRTSLIPSSVDQYNRFMRESRDFFHILLRPPVVRTDTPGAGRRQAKGVRTLSREKYHSVFDVRGDTRPKMKSLDSGFRGGRPQKQCPRRPGAPEVLPVFRVRLHERLATGSVGSLSRIVLSRRLIALLSME